MVVCCFLDRKKSCGGSISDLIVTTSDSLPKRKMNMNMEEAERLFDLVDTDKSGK